MSKIETTTASMDAALKKSKDFLINFLITCGLAIVFILFILLGLIVIGVPLFGLLYLAVWVGSLGVGWEASLKHTPSILFGSLGLIAILVWANNLRKQLKRDKDTFLEIAKLREREMMKRK